MLRGDSLIFLFSLFTQMCYIPSMKIINAEFGRLIVSIRAITMGDICRWSPERIRQAIRASNKQAVIATQKYVLLENSAIRTDYEFIACPCDESCWCKRHKCTGHYRIRKMSFDQFLQTYVNLWIPRKRERISRMQYGLELRSMGGSATRSNRLSG